MVDLRQEAQYSDPLLEMRMPTLSWSARLRQLLTYMLIGGSSTGVDMLLFNLLFWLWAPTSTLMLIFYSALSYIGSCVIAYQAHRRWTFDGAEPYKRRFWMFLGLNAMGLALNAALVGLLVYLLPMAFVLTPLEAANVAKLAAAGGSGTFSFLGNKFLVFRR